MANPDRVLQILNTRLDPGETVLVVAKASRLCDVRLEGLVHPGIVGAHFLDKAIRGRSWVPGIWALTARNLVYISNPLQAKSQARSLDRKIPISEILKVERHERVFRQVYDIAYRGGALYMLALKREADKLIPSIEAAAAAAKKAG
jgi:hypothetical protein